MFFGQRIIASLVAAGATMGALYLLDKTLEQDEKKLKAQRKEKAEEIANLVKGIEENRKNVANKKENENIAEVQEKELNTKAESISKLFPSVPLELIKVQLEKNIIYNSIGKPEENLLIIHKVRIPEDKVENFIEICKKNGYEVKKYRNGRLNLSCTIQQNSDVILGNVLVVANQTYFDGGTYLDTEIKNVA
jgi:seryl-tRNA synthetase